MSTKTWLLSRSDSDHKTALRASPHIFCLSAAHLCVRVVEHGAQQDGDEEADGEAHAGAAEGQLHEDADGLARALMLPFHPALRGRQSILETDWLPGRTVVGVCVMGTGASLCGHAHAVT